MSLTNTFDTHIKAISTAEEWAKYKAMVEDYEPPKVYGMVIDEIHAVGEPTYIRQRFRLGKIEDEIKAEKWPKTQNNKAMEYRVATDDLAIQKGTKIKPFELAHGIHFDTSSGNWYGNPDYLESSSDFEPVEQVQEGQYWQIGQSVVRVQSIKGDRCRLSKISTDNKIDLRWPNQVLEGEGEKLSTDEIESALIKEAKRRGFTNSNLPFKMKRNFAYGPIGGVGDIVEPRDFSEWHYNENKDLLEAGRYVYHEGVWNEIVDQTPHIEINGYQAEFHEDYVQFGCAKIHKNHILSLNDNLKSYGNVKTYQNDDVGECKMINAVRIGKGIFTREQIKEIAEYYE